MMYGTTPSQAQVFVEIPNAKGPVEAEGFEGCFTGFATVPDTAHLQNDTKAVANAAQFWLNVTVDLDTEGKTVLENMAQAASDTNKASTGSMTIHYYKVNNQNDFTPGSTLSLGEVRIGQRSGAAATTYAYQTNATGSQVAVSLSPVTFAASSPTAQAHWSDENQAKKFVRMAGVIAVGSN